MSHIIIQCDDCSKAHQIDKKEIDFEQVESHERQMGVESIYEGNIEIQCDCGQNIEVKHLFCEYPEGAENHKETKVSGGTVFITHSDFSEAKANMALNLAPFGRWTLRFAAHRLALRYPHP